MPKISQLPDGGVVLTGTQFAAVEAGVTVEHTVDELKTFCSASPTLVTPNLGTPSAGVLSSCTAASESARGVVELATTAEIDTGTDAARVMAVDQFAASNFGTASLTIPIGDSGTSAAVADGTWGVAVPSSMNGMNIVAVRAVAYTAGATGTTEFQLRRRRAGASADVLSTKITMAAQTVCSDGVIDAANDDLATGDLLFADVDAIETTAPLGVQLIVEARLP